MIKQEALPKGVGYEQFEFPKTFNNSLFLCVTILLLDNEVTLKASLIFHCKIMKIILINCFYFCFYFHLNLFLRYFV